MLHFVYNMSKPRIWRFKASDFELTKSMLAEKTSLLECRFVAVKILEGR